MKAKNQEVEAVAEGISAGNGRQQRQDDNRRKGQQQECQGQWGRQWEEWQWGSSSLRDDINHDAILQKMHESD